MARKVLVVLSCVASFILFNFVGGVRLASSATKSSIQEIEDFGNDYLLIYMERTAGIEGKTDTQVLKDAKLIKLGERYFVRGKGHTYKPYENDVKYKWYNGVDVAFDWKDVIQFSVLSPEQLESYEASMKDEP